MLVTFRSTATETITMFKDVADPLLKLMGASGKIPGAFTAADVPAALNRLESSIEQLKAQYHAPAAAPAADNEDASAEDDETRESPVALAIRAVPLISMMKRAAAAKAEVVWEGK
jgi:hypothetical protein